MQNAGLDIRLQVEVKDQNMVKHPSGEVANNNNNLSHNCLDGGIYVQSPELMGI